MLVYGIHFGEDPELLADFLAQTGITFPVVVDQNTYSKFAFPPGVGYPYPRDIIIGKDGVVRSIRNSFDPDETTALVQQLLAQ